jgi:2-keto-4-pentenoate hydratase/2-oxohepta-3-ene-1,7-dioic acid hydratase in catechol pathway
VRLLSPVVSPGRVIGVGLNYRSHAEEQGARIPRQPILFAKWSDSVVGPGATVAIPYAEAEVDYECEVAVVIGRAGRDIPIESALEHVFGITALNDLSDRKAQLAERQWTRAKSFDGFCPMGPAVVTLDEIPAVGDLAVSTTLNGVVVQQGSTSDLIFDIPTLVAFASQGTTLRPGDVIATGTPSGVGFVKDPPVYLRPGDVVTVAVEHVGELPTVIGAIAERTAS